MVSEIKLVVSGFNQEITTLVKELNSNETLYKSVENFQLQANEMLTKMVEEKRRLGDHNMDDSDDEDEDEDDDDSEDDFSEDDDDSDDVCNSPKKRKK